MSMRCEAQLARFLKLATLAQSFPKLTPTISVSTGVEIGMELVEQPLRAGKAGKQYKLLKY